MSCVYPLTLKNPRTKYPIQVSCGQCMNCRLQKSLALSFVCNLELQKMYRLNKSSSFITLTYDDVHVPLVSTSAGITPTLVKSDFQKFMKRFREILRPLGYKDNSYKIVACGEYGDKFGRPHFHFCAIGLNSLLSEYAVDRSWKLGLSDVGVLYAGGLNYVTKYMTKAVTGKQADVLYTDNGLEKPFVTHSVRIGDDWLQSHIEELMDNNWCYLNAGVLTPLPASVRRRLDIFKTLSAPDMRKLINSIAVRNGFDDVSDYKKITSFNAERMLIDYNRSKGIPCDSISIASAVEIYDINEPKLFVNPLIKDFATMALDG